MPALQFFSVFREAKALEYKKQALNYLELTRISAIAIGDPKFNKLLPQHYIERFHPSEPTQALDNEIAGAVLTQLLGGNA